MPTTLQADGDGQEVLILVGLVGSGKSTFANALEEHFPRFRRCNQDDLGNRYQVERAARWALREGYSVCVDRTNFNASQRAHWINIAREFPGTAVSVIVFDTPYNVCAARLLQRTSHPTIDTPELGLKVLARMASEFELPLPDEGHDRLMTLTHSAQSPSYTSAEIASIVQQLRHTAPTERLDA